jgi:hypothetical protein
LRLSKLDDPNLGRYIQKDNPSPMKFLTPLIIGASLLASLSELLASPIISEFMASNDAGLADEDGDFSDWIEIYNPDATAINLDGYFLSDDSADLTGWEFPAVTIEPVSFLVVFASNKDRSDPAGELHANFKLSANGGYLALVAADGLSLLSEFGPIYPPQFEGQSYGIGTFGSVTQEGLIDLGSTLRYFVPQDGSLGTTWTEEPLQFDDSSWTEARAGIGWESNGGTLEPAIATNISDDMRGKNASGYFRFPFTFSSTGKQVQSLNLTLPADDGFVAYINGMRVASHNDPTPLVWNSEATRSDGDRFVLETPSTHAIAATPGILVEGENILAIQGMNTSSGGSDFLIDSMLTAEVMDSTGTEREGYFDSPTPGLPNSGGQATGPIFLDVTDKPAQPVAGSDLVITAQVGGVAAPVDTVAMFYRVMFGAETTVSMSDDGLAPDALAGDGVFTAVIPGAEFDDGEMIRWRFLARDGLGLETRMPPFREPLDSHEYVGTVAVNPDVESLLTVVETFYPNPGAAGGTGGTRGAVFYLGELYDNIYANRHGQSTGGFPKKSYNLDFNKTQRFLWHPDEKRVKDIDLLTNWADKSKARHVLSWEIMREAGVHAHFAFTVRVQQNGDFFSTADFVEDADDIYLERAGLNPDGALYKIYNNTLSTGNSTVSPAVEKKNRRSENGQDLTDFINGLNSGSADQQWAFIYDNVNIPMMVNMSAANCVVRNTDMHRKNWYIYRDSGRTDEWATLPWDLDLAHGRKWNSSNNYFDNTLFTNGVIQVGTAVSLIQKMWARPEVRAMLNRRIRTLSDQFLNHPDTPYAQRYFERRLDEMLATIDPPGIVPSDAQQDFEKWGSWLQNGVRVPYTNTNPQVESMAEGVERWKNEYLPGRRDEIYNRQPSIPESQTGLIKYTYSNLFGSGAPVRVKVPTDDSDDATWMMETFDDSSWTSGLTGVGFDGSKYVPLIGVDTDGEMRGAIPRTSAYLRIEFQVNDPLPYQKLQLHMKFDDGYIAYLNGVKIDERNAPTSPSWNSSATTSGQEAVVDAYEVFDVSASVGELVAGTNVLAIHGMNGSTTSSDFLILPELFAGIPDSDGNSEPLIEFGTIEFNPDSGNQDMEYIEMVNNNNIAVDISNWTLGGGIEMLFAGGTVIPANSSLFVSPDVKAFRARTTSPKGGERRLVVGAYKGHLSSFGESLELRDASGALNSTTSFIGEPSDAQKYLVITEIMYHPEPDGAAEYLELMNISDTVTLDLIGINFSEGITFEFTDDGVTTLAPGERVLVVRDVMAFEAAHGAGLPVAGVFALASSLGNGGESLKLEDAEGGTIKEFTYNDKAPWPTTPDTFGFSLVLIAADTNPDPAEPLNWRASLAVGGTPGGSDAVNFSGDPAADADGDGLSALIEHALGSSDVDATSGADATSASSVEIGDASYATFSYQLNPAAEDVTRSVESSDDLATWTNADAQLVELASAVNADGTVTKTLQFATPLTGDSRQYFRLRVELR